MRYCLPAVCLFLLASAAVAQKTDGPSPGEKPSADMDLSGLWRGFVVEGKGEQIDRGSVKLELTIKDHQITAQRLDGEAGPLGEGTYKIKPGRLTQMDATQSSGQGRRRVYLGIFKLESDQIFWCVATPGNKRPARFETKGQQFLLILKRQ
jgi:uncharacterized protein (TIGR03067 family)